ncbi:MAG: hypothetical protein AB2L24_29410 [Mangrovibacterium sp.]
MKKQKSQIIAVSDTGEKVKKAPVGKYKMVALEQKGVRFEMNVTESGSDVTLRNETGSISIHLNEEITDKIRIMLYDDYRAKKMWKKGSKMSKMREEVLKIFEERQKSGRPLPDPTELDLIYPLLYEDIDILSMQKNTQTTHYTRTREENK